MINNLLVSIVTPSYNQAAYLEATLRSVLDQQFPNREYIVIDGASTDGSVDTLKRYSNQLTYWCSERDGGQAEAINRGFERASGDLITWINSDDLLLPGALAAAAEAHRRNADALILGDVVHFSESEHYAHVVTQDNVTLENMVCYWRTGWVWNQPGTFIPRAVWEKIGPLDERMRYVFDREWMIRALAAQVPVIYLGTMVAAFRLHSGSKTIKEAALWRDEQAMVTERYRPLVDGLGLRRTQAAQFLMDAMLRLSLLYFAHWDAATARHDLWRSVCVDPGIVTHTYWLLCIRALLPYWLVRGLRAQWLAARQLKRPDAALIPLYAGD
jgi:glycosyltransferase involved in cell wall biosynthesis